MPTYSRATFKEATKLHVAGKIELASELYRQVLRQKPAHAEALHQLGVIEAQKRNFQSAVQLLEQAVAIEPSRGAFQANLANALKDSGRLTDAIPHYLLATRAMPFEALPCINLGHTYALLNKHTLAIEAFTSGLKFKAEAAFEAKARRRLGLCLGLDHRYDEALTQLNLSLQLEPESAEALEFVAFLMCRRGSLKTALEACDQALEIDPRAAAVHNMRGLTLHKLQRTEEAVAAYRHAVELAPANTSFQLNLASALIQADRQYEAIDTAEKLARMEPNEAGGPHLLGGLYLNLARFEESLAAYDRSIELDPTHHNPVSGKIFAEHFVHGLSAADQAVTQRLFEERFGQPLTKASAPHTNSPVRDRKLRIGYISPNFNQHVLAQLMMPLFANHDREQVDVCVYSDVTNRVPITDRFEQLSTQFKSVVGMSDDQVADLIRADQIDILVDLTMHMADNRMLVFARRPAPVQVTWCYPGSTGLKAIDYRISDPYLDPEGLLEKYYSEKTIRLPHTFFCYDPLMDLPPAAPSPVLAEGRVTFGCLNNFCKLNSSVLQLWGRVISALPGSRLMLLSPTGERHRRWVEEELASVGVGPDRVEHVDRAPRREYMRLYDEIDICLDTFPYNGHTTSLDAFYMGVPVVTLVGDTVVGRAGLGQLTNLGLTDLIASSPDDFIQIAVALGRDTDRLVALRAGMRDRLLSSPLMDGPRFARDMEKAYRQMWHDWCSEHA